jgi:hypothetical protein
VHPSAPDRCRARRVRTEHRRDRVGRAGRRRGGAPPAGARSCESTAGWSINRSCCAPRHCSRARAERGRGRSQGGDQSLAGSNPVSL